MRTRSQAAVASEPTSETTHPTSRGDPVALLCPPNNSGYLHRTVLPTCWQTACVDMQRHSAFGASSHQDVLLVGTINLCTNLCFFWEPLTPAPVGLAMPQLAFRVGAVSLCSSAPGPSRWHPDIRWHRKAARKAPTLAKERGYHFGNPGKLSESPNPRQRAGVPLWKPREALRP
jgi:hypothetical protein